MATDSSPATCTSRRQTAPRWRTCGSRSCTISGSTTRALATVPARWRSTRNGRRDENMKTLKLIAVVPVALLVGATTVSAQKGDAAGKATLRQTAPLTPDVANAAQKGNLELVKKLIKQGAPVNEPQG